MCNSGESVECKKGVYFPFLCFFPVCFFPFFFVAFSELAFLSAVSCSLSWEAFRVGLAATVLLWDGVGKGSSPASILKLIHVQCSVYMLL